MTAVSKVLFYVAYGLLLYFCALAFMHMNTNIYNEYLMNL